MKGWRPFACLARRRIGLGEAGEFLPDVGSIGLSSSLGPRAFGPRMRGFPFSRSSTPRPTSRTNDAQASAIMKRRQPFLHLLQQPEGPKTKTQGPTMGSERTRNAYFAAAFEAGIGFEKKMRWGSA